MSIKKYSVLALSLLAVLLGTTFIYWRGLEGPFLLDDFLNIVDTYVNDFNWNEIYYAISHNRSGELGRPISILSLVFSGIVHGPVPWGYKFHNLAIHLINGLLIFWLLIKILPRLAPDKDYDKHLLVAGFSATIWLLHPLLVSTVLYAVQRMAQLSVLFTLAALLTYVYARDLVHAPRAKFYAVAYVLFPVFLLLSLFSKENGALIPLYILAIEWLVFRFQFDSPLARGRVLTFLGIFAVAPILLGSVYVATHLDQIADYSMRSFTMFERVLTELHVMVLYLKMILLPRLSDMTLFHDYIKVTTGFDPVTVILLLLFLGSIYLMYHLRNKAPVIAFAIAWFYVSHLMESTIFNLELMFEHRNYLAAVGPLFAVVYYICNIREYPKLQYLNVVLVAMLAFMTSARVGEWRSSDVIYQIAVLEHPDSTRALTSMANSFYRAGHINEAIAMLQRIQEVDPFEAGAYAHEAVYRCGTGTDTGQLFARAQELAASYPVSSYALNAMDNLVAVLNKGGCNEINTPEVLALVQAAMSQEDNKNNQLYTGFLEKIEGQIYLITGNYEEGIQLLLSAFYNTGLNQILSQLAENLLQLNLIGDAEVVVHELEVINERSHGSEQALLDPLKEKLQASKDRIASGDIEIVRADADIREGAEQALSEDAEVIQ